MGIFDFMKKSKPETSGIGMELPPIPKLEGDMFPEIRNEEMPPLPEISLPPLPTEMPKAMPTPTAPAPRMMPEITAPEPMPLPEPPKVEEEPTPVFPAFPEIHTDELIPDSVPPLEDLPEPPSFNEMNATAQDFAKPIERFEMPSYEEEIPRPVQTIKDKKGPLFIRSDRFKMISEDIEVIRSKFKAEDETFFRITEYKNTQDQKFERFRQQLEDVQRKLLFIDKSLFEKNR